MNAKEKHQCEGRIRRDWGSARAKHAAEKAARKKQELQKQVEELKRELKELEEKP